MENYPKIPEMRALGWQANCVLSWRFWLRLVPLTVLDREVHATQTVSMLRAFIERWPTIDAIAMLNDLPGNKGAGLSNVSSRRPAEDSVSIATAIRDGLLATVEPTFAHQIGYLDTALMPYVRNTIDVMRGAGFDVGEVGDYSTEALTLDLGVLRAAGAQVLATTEVFVGTAPSWSALLSSANPRWTPLTEWFTWRFRGDRTPSSAPNKVDQTLATLGDTFWTRHYLEVLADLGHAIASPDNIPSLQPPPAPLPAQDTGARFEWRDSTLHLGHPTLAKDADVARLERLKPLVVDSLSEFLEATPSVLKSGSNDPFARVRRHAESYLHALTGSAINDVDYDYLFGLGTMLQNRLAADLERSLESDLASFSPRQRVALQDFQTQHGLLITATEAGLKALAAAERVERNPAEERAVVAAIQSLVDDMGSIVGIATPEVLSTVRDAADEIGNGKQAERSTVYGMGTARNLAIVIFAGATVAAAATVGSLVGPIGTAFAYATGLIVLEATKKSAAFSDLAQPITSLMDTARAGQLLDAIRRHGDDLRLIAGTRPEMSWLREYLAWLSNPESYDPSHTEE
jgi:hypothetical protein